jgi:hypothetical protein
MVWLPMSCTSVALPQPPTPLRDMRSPGLVATAGALLLGTADYSGMVVARKSHPTRAEENNPRFLLRPTRLIEEGLDCLE